MKIRLSNQNETEALAVRLAQMSEPGDVIALKGNLGMGKSVFARAFVRALTSEQEEVPSPTFTLVQMYEADVGEVYHFDMYRLEQPDDCLELGVEEAFSDGVCLVEWPDNIGPYLPWDSLMIEIIHDESDEQARWMEINAAGKWETRLKEVQP